jgi:hypothetical protein
MQLDAAVYKTDWGRFRREDPEGQWLLYEDVRHASPCPCNDDRSERTFLNRSRSWAMLSTPIRTAGICSACILPYEPTLAYALHSV